ncbi:MAG: tetratricopeptide repeat protein, partial [Bacilli bacterium]
MEEIRNLLQEEQYEKALVRLHQRHHESPGEVETLYLMGLAYIEIGNPAQALHYWEQIDVNTKPEMKDKCDALAKQIVLHERQMQQYRYVLTRIDDNALAQAETLFESIFTVQKILPLPNEVYYTYSLLKLSLGRKEEVKQFIDSLPPHIKGTEQFQTLIGSVVETQPTVRETAPNVHNLQAILLQEEEKLVAERKKNVQKRWRVAVGVGGVVLLAVAAVFLFMQYSDEPNTRPDTESTEKIEDTRPVVPEVAPESTETDDVSDDEKMGILLYESAQKFYELENWSEAKFRF